MNTDTLFTKPIAKQFEFDADVAAVFDDMLSRSVPFYQESQRLTTRFCLNALGKGGRVLDLIAIMTTKKPKGTANTRSSKSEKPLKMSLSLTPLRRINRWSKKWDLAVAMWCFNGQISRRLLRVNSVILRAA